MMTRMTDDDAMMSRDKSLPRATDAGVLRYAGRMLAPAGARGQAVGEGGRGEVFCACEV